MKCAMMNLSYTYALTVVGTNVVVGEMLVSLVGALLVIIV